MLLNLQPGHLVGVSGNVIWVTSQAPGCEHVHQFEMFAIYVVIKLVIKSIIFLPRCQATGIDMASSLYPHSCAWAQMLPPKYEEDKITQYWVVLHFSCILYTLRAVWPSPLTYLYQNVVMGPEPDAKDIYFEVYRPLRFLKYSITECIM